MSKAIQRGKRSKFGVDIMYRLWDSHNSCWLARGSRTIWPTKSFVEKFREALIEEGRDADTVSVERVFVEVK
jgi:hypothetical protein